MLIAFSNFFFVIWVRGDGEGIANVEKRPGSSGGGGFSHGISMVAERKSASYVGFVLVVT